MPPDPQTERLVIGIAGRIGAGKTSAARYLSARYGLHYFRYSLVLAEWRASDRENKAGLQEVGWEIMGGGLQKELNNRLIARIEKGVSAVVDGLRHPIDYASLQDCFLPSFHFFYIDSPPTLRWLRLRNRGRYSTREAFEAADSHPVEQQIEALRSKSATPLQNKGSLDELYASLDAQIGQ